MTWAHILGHDALVDAFGHVVQRHRLAHAYLFSGPAGVGKRMFARELAKALLCEAPDNANKTLTSCGRCQACILVDAGNHPDFFGVQRPEDKNEMPIELMQELCVGFSLKSARGQGKVAVLDDADDLNAESANCFLKTLEEPPPRSVFILIGSSVDRQLPTIVSRCQVVRFRPLPPPILEQILRQNDIEDSATIQRLVHLSGGSPGRALALVDPDLWEFHSKLLEGLTRPKIDAFGLAKCFVEFAEDAGKELALQRRRVSLVFGLVIAALRDALAQSQGKPAGDDDKILTALTNRADTEKIATLIERCLEAERHLGRYVQIPLVLEALLDAMAQTLEEGAPALASRS
ncbi:MAG: DNA polymerase III subunit delta' [Planctomycetes bacterium]|nr:DNA polymerase III subunit delta' [Planctomycetota bacterium]